MIEAENIFHQFGGKMVLNGVSLVVRAGEIVVVMGPNGMGKSTLLSAIGGALAPMEGVVRINGLTRRGDPDNEMAVRRGMMYLPDDPWAPPVRTARQWAFAVGRMFGGDERALVEHIDSLMGLFDMGSVGDAPISSYSAGQKKKAQLISALAPMTPVLVFDEPFSGGLDPTGLFAIKEILRRRAKNLNHTVLIATPTPELVEEVADRIIILRGGEVTAEGTLAELREQARVESGLAGIYERLSSTDIESRVADYEQRFLSL